MLAAQLLVWSASSFAETGDAGKADAAKKESAEKKPADKAAAKKSSAKKSKKRLNKKEKPKAAAAKSATGKAAAEKAAAEKAAVERAAEKAAAEKAAAEKAAAEKAAAEKAAAERAANKIVTVKVIGNRIIETPTIMQAIALKPGDQLDRDKADADLRAVYKLGHFRDVQVRSEKVPGGIALAYVVQEKPVVREVKIEGAKEIKPDKVREALDIKPNTIYSVKELQKGLKKVKKLYADDGYYLAEVDGDISKRSDTEVNVIVRVKEGEKVLIQTIKFEGNRALTDRKLKKAMETGEKWWLSWLTGAGTYKEEVLKNDVLLLTELYMNDGYATVKVGEPRVDLLPDRTGLTVTIGITEGDQYRIGSLGVKGDLLETSDVLMNKLKEKSGELFSRAKLRDDVVALTDVYADKGYAFANANPRTKLNPDIHTMDITFDMEKGEKVHVDRINISGNSKSRDKVVRREMRIDEGDLYSATAIKKSKQNIMNTGFFEEANLTTAKGSVADKLDINVDVKEKATGTFSIGAGYSSLDGIVGQGSVQQSNFLGLGLKLTAAASIGARSRTYNLGMTDPYFLDSKWTVGGDIYRTERQYIDYTRRATGADVKAGYPITDTLSTFWLYKFEVKQIYSESESLLEQIHNGSIVAPVTDSTTSAIVASLSSNTTDFHPDPTTGFIDTLSVEFAGLGGSNRYLRYLTDHTYFHPLVWGMVGSLHGALGYIQGVGMDVPIDEKFYLGGMGSIRGYSVRTVCPIKSSQVTPTDFLGIGTSSPDNVYLGGQMEAIANAEVTFPLLKDAGLKGVVFFDAGNSQDTLSKTFGNVLTSYGGGIRWMSPIGPLRLEYGVPLKPRANIDHSGGRVEFSMGSVF